MKKYRLKKSIVNKINSFLMLATGAVSISTGVFILFVLGYQDPLGYTIEQQLTRYQIGFYGLLVTIIFGYIAYCFNKIVENN